MVVLLAAGASMNAAVGASCQVNPNIPKTPPANPMPRYTGLQTQATVTDNAGRMAQTAVLGLNVISLLANDATLYRLTPQCNNTALYTFNMGGGSVISIAARMNPKGTSWYLIHYLNAHVGTAYVLNGSVIMRRGPKSGGRFNATLGYLGLKLTSGSGIGSKLEDVLYGTVTATNVSVDFNNSIKESELVNLSIADELRHNTTKLSGVSLNIKDGIDRQISGISGRFYASDIGYFDLDPAHAETLEYAGASSSPVGIGALDLHFVGQGVSTAELTPTNSRFGYLAVDADGDGIQEAGARFDLSAVKLDNTVGPSADGLPQAVIYTPYLHSAYINFPVTLHGRYSHSQLGKLLTFRWKLMAAPPDSAAVLDATTGPVNGFTPDLAGDYLISLTVTDGTLFSQDMYVMTAGASTPPVVPTDSGFSLGADVHGHVKQLVRLDGRATTHPFYKWSLQAPPGSKAKLSSTSSANPTFTPDVPGYYAVNTFQGVRQVIAVDEDLHFSPAVHTPNGFQHPFLLSADLNSDGTTETLMAGSNVGQFLELTPQGEGLFSSTTLNTPLIDSPYNLLIGDMDGDGQPDIVYPNKAGVYVALQQSDHSLGAATKIANSGCTAITTLNPMFAKIGNNTLKSLVWTCDQSFDHTFMSLTPDGSGGYTPATITVPNTTGTLRFQGMADLNGDGINDAVFVGDSVNVGLSNSNLVVVTGNADGTFNSPVAYPLDSTSTPPKVLSVYFADINGDSKTDVIVAAQDVVLLKSPALYYFLQEDSGVLGVPQFMTPPYARGGSGTLGQFIVPKMLDIDSDGSDELVVLGKKLNNDSISCDTPNFCGLFIYRWNPDGHLDKPVVYLLEDYPFEAGPVMNNYFYMADVNGDGVPDLVVVDADTAGQYVLYGADHN